MATFVLHANTPCAGKGNVSTLSGPNHSIAVSVAGVGAVLAQFQVWGREDGGEPGKINGLVTVSGTTSATQTVTFTGRYKEVWLELVGISAASTFSATITTLETEFATKAELDAAVAANRGQSLGPSVSVAGVLWWWDGKYYKASPRNNTQHICTNVPICSNTSRGPITAGNTNANYRIQHTSCVSVSDISAIVGNGYNSSALLDDSANFGAGNPITVSGAIEYNGVRYPLSFSGVRSVSVAQNTLIMSDAIPLRIAKGDTFYSVWRVQGSAWPVYGPTSIWGVEDASTTDYTTFSTSPTFPTSPRLGAGWHPSAIIGTPTTDATRVAAVIGDSIARGVGDVNGTPTTVFGYIDRALFGSVPVLRLGLGSDYPANFRTWQKSIFRRSIAQAISAGVDTVCWHFGTNQVNSVAGNDAATIADLQALFAEFSSLGMRQFAGTLCPKTTSTDSWATLANQTTVAGFAPGGNAERINTWILQGGGGYLLGSWDCMNVLADASTMKWIPGHTDDGTHPNASGTLALRAVVPVSLISGA